MKKRCFLGFLSILFSAFLSLNAFAADCAANHYTDTDGVCTACPAHSHSNGGDTPTCTCDDGFTITGLTDGDTETTNNACVTISDFVIKTTSNINNFSFTIYAPGSYTVDWGDGTIETGGAKTFSHTYAVAKEYIIGLSGEQSAYYGDGGRVISFENNTNIVSLYGSLGIIFNKGSSRSTFSATFNGCTSLESIPSTLFDGAPDFSTQSMFYSTFKNCSSLKFIPEGLFDWVTKSSYGQFEATFYGCSSLEKLPDGLFKNITGQPGVDAFDSTFSNCTSLSGYVPANMFQSLTDRSAGGTMDGIFDNTNLATSCPSDTYQYKTGFEAYWSGKVSCAICPDAYPYLDDNATSINACYLITESGQYVPNGGMNPVICDAGLYCPGNTTVYYGNSGGSTACPANYFCPAGAVAATPCPANSHSDVGATVCTCDDGYSLNGNVTDPSDQETTTTDCKIMKYSIWYWMPPKSGPPDIYVNENMPYTQSVNLLTSDQAKEMVSSQWPGEGYKIKKWVEYIGMVPTDRKFDPDQLVTVDDLSEGQGALSLVAEFECAAGYYADGDNCLPCKAGEYCPGDTSAGKLPPVACPAGSYCPDGADAPIACPDSHPLSNAGAVSEAECYAECSDSEIPGGFIKPQYPTVAYPGKCEYAATTINCNLGYYADWGAAQCVECPVDSMCYNNDRYDCPLYSGTNGSTGQSYCTCANGHTVDGTKNGETITQNSNQACQPTGYMVYYLQDASQCGTDNFVFADGSGSYGNYYTLGAADVGVDLNGKIFDYWAVCGYDPADGWYLYEAEDPSWYGFESNPLSLYPVLTCPTGTYGENCDLCPEGFRDGAWVADKSQCDRNCYNHPIPNADRSWEHVLYGTDGSAQCTYNCSSKYYWDDNAGACEYCPDGYRDGYTSGRDIATQCLKNCYSDAPEHAEVDGTDGIYNVGYESNQECAYKCSAGYYGDANNCQSCPDGQYCPGGEVAEFCPDNSVPNAATEWEVAGTRCNCLPGYTVGGNASGSTTIVGEGDVCSPATYIVNYYTDTSSSAPTCTYDLNASRGESVMFWNHTDQEFRYNTQTITCGNPAASKGDGYKVVQWKARTSYNSYYTDEPVMADSEIDINWAVSHLSSYKMLDLAPVYGCAAGYYGNGETTCTSCEAGSYCPGSTTTPTASKYECPAGSFCPAGAAEPQSCADLENTSGVNADRTACVCMENYTDSGYVGGGAETTDGCRKIQYDVTYWATSAGPNYGGKPVHEGDSFFFDETYYPRTASDIGLAGPPNAVLKTWGEVKDASKRFAIGEPISPSDIGERMGIWLYPLEWQCDAGYYGENGNCTACPTGYISDAGATQESECYLTTTAGNWVASAGAQQTICPADSYCTGGTKVYYNTVGGSAFCLSNSSTNGVTGATSVDACFCDAGFTTDGTADGGNQPVLGSLGCGLVPDVEIVVDMSGYSSFPITITAAGDFYIQWYGNNDNDKMINKSVGAQYATFMYPPISEATIKIAGNATAYDSTQAAIIFSNPARIKSIKGNLGAIFPTVNDQSPRFDNLLSGAYRVTELPHGLFDGVTTSAPRQFASAFAGMTGLTTIPDDLFSGITGEPAENAFNNTFADASNVASVTASDGTTTNYLPISFFGGLTEPANYNSNMFNGAFVGTELSVECPLGMRAADLFYTDDIAPKVVCETVPDVTVSYNLNGGTGSYATRIDNYAYGATVGEPKPSYVLGASEVNRPGYVFTKWSFDEEGSTTVSSFTVTEDTVLYAIWEPCAENTFKTGAVAPGAACSACPENSTSAAGASACTCNTGYSVGADKTTTTTVGASCDANTYDLTFTDDMGKTLFTIPVQTGGQFTTPPEHTKTGYNQMYWMHVAGGAANLDMDTTYTFTSDMVAIDFKIWFARYQPATYTINFDANGGTGGQTEPVTATYNSALPEISTTAPTRAGSVFLGWYDENGTQYYDVNGSAIITKWTSTSDITLYAKWSCAAGYYGDGSTCTICPNGYTSNQSTTYVSDCAIICAAGYAVLTPNGDCENVGAGKWIAENTVNYGGVSSVNSCASGLTTIGYGAGADEAADCGRILHIGENKLYLRSARKNPDEIALHVRVGGSEFYGNMTTEDKRISYGATQSLKINVGGVQYCVYDDSAM